MGTVRLFLALGVVFGHAWHGVLQHVGLQADPAWWLNIIADRAVMYFYIVSGFLMSFVLHEKYTADQRGTAAFLRSRFLRIYPLWWAVFALCLIVDIPPMPHLPQIPSAILLGSDWLVAFADYPARYWNHLPYPTGVAWTLGAELMFYLLAPWLLRSWRLAIAAFALSFAIRLAVPWFVSKSDFVYLTWMYCFFPAILMFFLLGHFAHMAFRVMPIGTAASVAALILAAVFSEFSGTDLQIVDQPLAYASCLFFALALPGLFLATKNSVAHNFLGDLTYPLYLTHELTIAAIFWPWNFIPIATTKAILAAAAGTSPALGATFLMVTIFAASLAIAWITHFAVERPARKIVERLLSMLPSFSRAPDRVAAKPLG